MAVCHGVLTWMVICRQMESLHDKGLLLDLRFPDKGTSDPENINAQTPSFFGTYPKTSFSQTSVAFCFSRR